MKIPKLDSYDVAERDYRAFCRDAFEQRDGTLRIVFEITSLEDRFFNYVAGKNYADGKQTLAQDLMDWLGLAELNKIVGADGTINHKALRGRNADIRVSHIHNDDHEKPYCYVSKITKPGGLLPDISSAA